MTAGQKGFPFAPTNFAYPATAAFCRKPHPRRPSRRGHDWRLRPCGQRVLTTASNRGFLVDAVLLKKFTGMPPWPDRSKPRERLAGFPANRKIRADLRAQGDQALSDADITPDARPLPNSLEVFLCLTPAMATAANPLGIPKDASPLTAQGTPFGALCSGLAVQRIPREMVLSSTLT